MKQDIKLSEPTPKSLFCHKASSLGLGSILVHFNYIDF